MVEQIIPVCIGGDGGPFVRVGAQVDDHGNAHFHEGFTPDLHGPLDPLLGEPELPVVVAQAQQVAVVREIEVLLARAFGNLAREQRQQVVAIQVDFEGLLAGRIHVVARQELCLEVGFPGHGGKRRQPIHVAHDFIGHGAGFDVTGPAHHRRDAERAFPVGILLAAEGGHAAIGPGVHVRAVVRAVEEQRVIGDAQFIQHGQHLADVLVVIDHHVVIFGLPAPRLPHALRFLVRAEVHVGGIDPDEEGLAGRLLFLDQGH